LGCGWWDFAVAAQPLLDRLLLQARSTSGDSDEDLSGLRRAVNGAKLSAYRAKVQGFFTEVVDLPPKAA
jgi:hypothetical protein